MTVSPQAGLPPAGYQRLSESALAASARDHLWMHFTRHSTYEQGGSVPVITRGEGAYIWDDRGRRYLDGLSGLFVVQAGHGRRELADAAARQAGELAFFPLWSYAHPEAIQLAERLASLAPGDLNRVFFTTGGGEAVESAWKLARQYFKAIGEPGRYKVISRDIAYHGATMGALSITGQPAKRAPFEPLPGPVTFVPYGDAEALRRVVDTGTASVILEPVLGEAGVVEPPPGYLEAAREITAAAGALLHLDEVQGGIGRVGHWLTSRVLAPGVEADVLTLAKGLGGGLPLGAVVANGAAARALRKGDHGTTFGGNPVSCAAALAVLDTIERDGLLAVATTLGTRLRTGIIGLQDPLVDHVRGLGLWLGVVLSEPRAAEVEKAARAAGFLVNAAAPNVIRLAPPLVLTGAQVDAFVDALPGIFHAARVSAVPAGSLS